MDFKIPPAITYETREMPRQINSIAFSIGIGKSIETTLKASIRQNTPKMDAITATCNPNLLRFIVAAFLSRNSCAASLPSNVVSSNRWDFFFRSVFFFVSPARSHVAFAVCAADFALSAKSVSCTFCETSASVFLIVCVKVSAFSCTAADTGFSISSGRSIFWLFPHSGQNFASSLMACPQYIRFMYNLHKNFFFVWEI